MAIYDNARDTLLAGLSSFWNRLFADRDVLNAMYAGVEEKLAEVYLDILHDVMAASLVTVPIFRQRFWELVTLRQDDIVYDATKALPYRVDFSQTDLRGLSVLYAQLVMPELILEDGVQYVFDETTQVLAFSADPVTLLQGTATRWVNIDPTVYALGSYAQLPTEGEVVIEEILRRGNDGVFTALVGAQTQFDSATGGFSSQDVGLTLNTAAGTATIIQVISTTRVVVDATLAAAAPVSWTLEDRDIFTGYDVGRQVRIYDPTDPAAYEDYMITAVTSANHVELDRAVAYYAPSTTRRFRWAFVSRATVQEFALWAPRADVDGEDIADRYGALIGRIEPSSASYKALVRGIYQYYLLGPSLSRIEAALDVFVGVPVVATDGEEVLALDTSKADADRVVTDAKTYTVPKGSIDPALEVGQVLSAFQSLTQIFTVSDHISDPDWFHGKTIPQELIAQNSVPDRAIDPKLYPNSVGSTARTWYVGAPLARLGADENGQPLTLEGKDGYAGASPNILVSRDTKFDASLAGKTVTIGVGSGFSDVDVTIVSVGLDAAAERGALTLPASVTVATPTLTGTIDYAEPYLRITTPGWRWENRDRGRMITFTASSIVGLAGTYWRVIEVVSRTDVRVEPWDAAVPVIWAAGHTFTAQVGFHWAIRRREGLHHNLGYQLAQQELRHHIAYLAYDVASYPGIPYPRASDDIRDVLFAGKPAHIYFFLDAAGSVDDEVGVQESTVTIAPTLYDTVQHENPKLTVGSGWNVGDYYHWMGLNTSWLDIVREEQLGTLTELRGSAYVEELVLSLEYVGTSASVDVDLYVWTGSTWTFWQTVSLSSSGTATHILAAPGLRVAADITATGGTYTRLGVAYGGRLFSPGVVTATPATGAFSSTASATGNAVLEDLNVTFYAFDQYRTLYVTVAGVETAYWIRTVLSEHQVYLIDKATSAPAVLPAGTGYTIRFGAPRQLTTPLTVGQASKDVTRTGAVGEEHLVDWPVQVNLSQPPGTAHVVMQASMGLAATPVVS